MQELESRCFETKISQTYHVMRHDLHRPALRLDLTHRREALQHAHVQYIPRDRGAEVPDVAPLLEVALRPEAVRQLGRLNGWEVDGVGSLNVAIPIQARERRENVKLRVSRPSQVWGSPLVSS